MAGALDKNKWDQRKITMTATIHHKNQVLSMKGITGLSSTVVENRAHPETGLATTTKVEFQPRFRQYTM